MVQCLIAFTNGDNSAYHALCSAHWYADLRREQNSRSAAERHCKAAAVSGLSSLALTLPRCIHFGQLLRSLSDNSAPECEKPNKHADDTVHENQ